MTGNPSKDRSRRSPADVHRRVAELTSRLLDDDLDEPSRKELDALLVDSEDARDSYLAVVELHADLGDGSLYPDGLTISALDRTTDVPASSAIPKATQERGQATRWPLRRLAAAALVVAVCGVLLLWRPDHRGGDERRFAAELVAAEPAAATVVAVSPEVAELTVGTPIDSEIFVLSDGTVELRLTCGVSATLAAASAPVQLVFVDELTVRLESGETVFRVPPEAIGFRCETEAARVIDLGTEFGVAVDGNQTEVQVYDGEVIAETITSATGAAVGGAAEERSQAATSTRLTGGQAVRIAAGVQTESSFWPERFVRHLPDPERPEHPRPRSAPYNAPVHESIRIGWATERPTIDGHLDEWDASRMFESRCEAPYGAFHNVRGALMYDDECLYVGATVADPFPMRSLCSPEPGRETYGRGGCLALRIGTDRQMGWPVRGRGSEKGRTLTPIDRSEHLNFAVLWHYAPKDLACIQLRQGMDFHNLRINPAGYEGCFRRTADGLGYTVEYAISWGELGAGDDPPQPGDELGLTWLVHWAGPEGRQWRGQLVDIVNPDAEGWNFQNAATWGRAIYEPPPASLSRPRSSSQ